MANAELLMDMDFSAGVGYSDAEAQARLDAVTVDKASYPVLNAGVWDATYHSNHKTVNLYVTWSNTSYTQAQLVQAYYDCITCIELEDLSEGTYDYSLLIDGVVIEGGWGGDE